MTAIRRIVTLRDVIHEETGQRLETPVTRAVGMAVIANPFAATSAGSRFVADLSPLFPVGREIGEKLTADLAAMLGRPPVSYGKAAIVGVAGEKEHGGAAIHPALGKPMRAAIGGGEALIPSNVKVGLVGTAIDLPLGHKDEAWSFDHFDTITVSVPDAPRADEIVVVIGLADAGRPLPRCGNEPI